jgi:transposase
MLGPVKARNLDRPVLIAIESAVPKGHLYRHLHRTLDLSFVRDLVADCYAVGGRPSIDPEVFFKLELMMFFEGIRSERKLMEQAGYNLAMRWYAGYNMDEPLPDHSSLSKIRTRLGLPVFRRFFEAITEQCVAAGLVRGDELIFDATKVRANAAMDSLIPDCACSPRSIWQRSNRRSHRRHSGPAMMPAGICWRSAVSIRRARPPRGTSARATGSSAPLTPTRSR